MKADETSLAKSLKKQRHNRLSVLTQRIVAAGYAPVVHETTFKHGIRLGDIVDGQLVLEKALPLTLHGYLAQKLVVGSVGVQQMSLGAGCQLSGKKPCQKLDGYGV